MRGKRIVGLSALGLLLLLLAPTANAQWAHLELQSEPGDWIGQGQDWDIWYTPSNSDNFFDDVVMVLPSGEPSYVRFILGTVTGNSSNTYTHLNFATNQLDLPLVPGIYLDAQRAAFAQPGHPGLDVSFQNRGSNTLTGWFEIESAVYVDDPGANNGKRIEYFRANFEQHSEGAAPALYGQFEYSAVPEPATALALLPGIFFLRRRKQRSK